MKTLLYALVGLIVVVSTAIGGFFGINNTQDSTYSIGDVVEDFTVQNLNGQSVSLTDVAGSSGSILIFTSNSCPFSKLYDERILQLADVYSDAGYPVIIINSSDPLLKPEDAPEELNKWVSANNYNGVFLLDNVGIFQSFGSVKTPEVFLLDEGRKLKYRGAIDNGASGAANVTEKYLENAIRALENGEDPDPSETRAMGCVIKA